MYINTIFKCLSKKVTKYTSKEGVEKESYKITYSQNNDDVVGETNVPFFIYETMTKGNEFTMTGEYRTTRNGNYIAWQSAKLADASHKALL